MPAATLQIADYSRCPEVKSWCKNCAIKAGCRDIHPRSDCVLAMLCITLWYGRDLLLKIIAISLWFQLRLENSLLIHKVT